LVWANIGGMAGSVIVGLITKRVNLRALMIGVLIAAFVMVSVFGLGQSTLMGLCMIAAATGFFTNSSVVACYALLASSFPAEVRASGTGVVIGIGRGGAVLAPIVAGFLFTAGHGLFFVSVLMGLGALVAAACVFGIGLIITKQEKAQSN
jgi:MFS family permease